MSEKQQINFEEVNSTARLHLDSLLERYLPGGKRAGAEYVVRNPTRADNSPGSFKINLRSGAWSDFATGDAGGDPVSLYAYIRGVSQAEAATTLMQEYGGRPAPKKRAPKGEKMTWTPVIPIPDGVSEPPEEHYRLKRYSTRWAYKDCSGKLMGYTCRFDLENGEKDILPLTWCRNESGRGEWRWKSFELPRPMYGLDRLRDVKRTVLVVEGEKCADVGGSLLQDMAVLSWIGGSKATGKVDWEPLKGREVVLWPDNDETGSRAMLCIAERLRDIAKSVHIVPPPHEKPSGWDIADAISEGWTADKLKSFITSERMLPDKFRSSATDNGDGSNNKNAAPETTYHDKLADAPFRCLGYNRGMYYYLPAQAQQVVELQANHHTSKNLLSLAPLGWWWAAFPGDRSPSWQAAMDALFRKCHRVGIYDAQKVRGCGAWFDEGRVVLHHGDHLLVDGRRRRIHDFDTPFIYEAGPATEITSASPLPLGKAKALADMSKLVAWDKPVGALLFAGWCVTAPICGALTWRPHIWMTGGRGTGKTFLMDNIVKPLLGRASLAVQSNTTEAGIRQALGNNAFPVIFDESEGEDKHGRRRIQQVLELVRQASSETGAVILKGSQGGKAMSYRIRSSFCMASIGVQIQQAADASRITILELGKHHPKDREDLFDELKENVFGTLSREWCAGFRARAVKMIPVIRKNATMFARIVAEILGDQRTGDQIGTLLAGAYSLYSDATIDAVTAGKWVSEQDWSEHTETDTDPDEVRCLHWILQHTLTVNQDGRRLERSVVKLIGIAAEVRDPDRDAWEPDEHEVTREDAVATLARNGVKVNQKSEEIVISSSHHGIKRMLSDSPWENGWARILKRIDGAKDIPVFRFEVGIRTRAVSIPMTYVFDEDISA